MKRFNFILPGICLILLVILLQGCTPSHGKRYFQLAMLPGENMPQPRVGKIMLVQPVEVDAAYDDYRLVYRLSTYELNYYSYEFWIKKPGTMMRDVITDCLSRGGAFAKVIMLFSEGDPDFLLDSAVEVIEEYDRPDAWFARLKMSIKIKDFKTNEPVLVHQFDRKEKLTEKKVEKVPVVLSMILEEELAKVVEQLAEKLK
ncbi:MAG: ABC-type transport auxiliary lipoprotein family protein [Candidatus Aminicenantes bacterium]|nr:ABC-type transport auxiliary lipoprotein family protein [Candidatus Aminicenantes bacterium]